MLRFGKPPYLECSSRGDRRFSAFYARPSIAGGLSIEEAYQAAKVFNGPSGEQVTGLSWRVAKGRLCLNQKAVRKYYTYLWRCYIRENPALLSVLHGASGLSDMFGQSDHACQAEELWKIRNAKTSGRRVTPLTLRP